MAQRMMAAQITTPGETRVIEAPVPVPGPDDVLIQVQAAGICGTDIHILHGEYEAQYPLIPGHEFSGIVAAIGSNVQRFQPGDRVTADPNIPCGKCIYCQRNQPNQCKNLAAVGVTRDGGFARYVSVPEGNVFPLGDLSFAAGALVEPLACVVWGLQRVAVQPGDSVLVLGAGPMGCLLAQGLRGVGAGQVVASDMVQGRLDLVKKLGASAVVPADAHQAEAFKDLAPEGFDIVVDATGSPKVLSTAIEYTRPRGKLWVFGVAPPDAQATYVPYDVFRKDLTIIGSFAVNRTFQESIAMIASGAVQVEPLISHRLPLAQFAEGMDLAEHDPGRMKVQFTFED